MSEAQAKFVEDYVHLDVSGTSQRVKQEALTVGGRHQHKHNLRGTLNQANFSGSNNTSVNNFHNKASQRPNIPSQSKTENKIKGVGSGEICNRCGQVHRVKCPAEGKTCSNCQKVGHFAKVCRSKKVSGQNHARQVRPDVNPTLGASADYEALSESSEHSFAVNPLGPGETPRARIKIGESEITIHVDTGASTTIIDEAHFARLIPKPVLVQSRSPVFGFSSSTPLDILGEFEATLILGSRKTSSLVSVVRGECGCLLSCNDCVKLDLVSLNEGKLVRSVKTERVLTMRTYVTF